MSPRRRRALATVVVAVATFAPIAAAEAALRVTRRFYAPVAYGWRWAGSPLRNELAPDAADATNELGLRGRSIAYGDDDAVVVLVGDSQVEAATLPLDQMPEVLLERSLEEASGRTVRVVSIGASGWGQDQQLVALREYLARWRADAVVVWATPSNDFFENTFADRSTNDSAGPVKPTFLLRDGRLEGPFYTGPRGVDRLLVGQVARIALSGRSYAEGVRARWDRRIPSADRGAGIADCAGTRPITQRELYGRELALPRGGRYELRTIDDVVNSRSHFSPRTHPRSPRDAYQVAITTALYAALHDEASRAGAGFAVLTTTHEVREAAERLVACVRGPDGRSLEVHPTEAELMASVAPRGSVVSVRIDGGYENLVSRTDQHLGAVGNPKAMRGLAEELVARGLVPRG
jgi:hypothetical protein